MLKFQLMEKMQSWAYGDLTLEKQAELTGLSINFLFRFIHGKVVLLDVYKLEKLCQALDCTPNDLLWSDEESS